MNTLEAIVKIEAAAVPEDVFGPRGRDGRRDYRALAALVHPDRATPTLRDRAGRAFARLTALYREWCTPNGPMLDGEQRSYRLGNRHRRGTVATLYVDGSAVVKVPREPSSNMLVGNERAALRDIAATTERHVWLEPYFPRLVDTAVHVDPATIARREIDVLDALVDGFVSLADVADAYPDGLDQRDYAWMHRRLLRAVAGAHEAGWVHGAIFADNVLIHPELHGVVLVGWSYATRPGSRLAATIPGRRYAPEVLAGEPVTSETDVYQAHSLMLAMLGDRAPAPIRAFARGCMQERPGARPGAADLLDEYDDLLDRLYGRRRFRPFTVPITRTAPVTTTKGQ